MSKSMLTRADEETHTLARGREARRAHPRRRSVSQPIRRRWFRLVQPLSRLRLVHHHVAPLTFTTDHQTPETRFQIGARRVFHRLERRARLPLLRADAESTHVHITRRSNDDDVVRRTAPVSTTTFLRPRPRVRVDDVPVRRRRRRRRRPAPRVQNLHHAPSSRAHRARPLSRVRFVQFTHRTNLHRRSTSIERAELADEP